jgi:hypothetical protein
MKFFMTIILVFATAASPFAQGRGKAEANEIKFAAGRSSAVLHGTLKRAEEIQYFFKATKGQTVTIKNPMNYLYDFRIFNNEIDFETEFDSSPTSTIELPEDGNYLLFVRRKVARAPKNTKFSITLTIK